TRFRSEYKTIFQIWRLPEDLAVEIFPKLDFNKDGGITKDESVELVQQFHQSDDPDAPGKIFFGLY
ncbi:MAG: calcium sensor EFh, partial [Okeania sp. SIO1H6]|nr:calcium sensor EFh [Okeania sp. SIO1H6]